MLFISSLCHTHTHTHVLSHLLSPGSSGVCSEVYIIYILNVTTKCPNYHEEDKRAGLCTRGLQSLTLALRNSPNTSERPSTSLVGVSV